jgi:membrane protein implicated in regulation of membrane protease activity
MDAALIFFLIMFAGFIFVVLTAVMGGFGHMGGGDVDATGSDFDSGDAGGDAGGDSGDAGGHDMGDGDGHGPVHFPRLSPLLIAIFATTFGGFGWMFQVFTPWLGIVLIVLFALVISAGIAAAVFYGFIRTMARMQGSAVYQLADARGTVGTVSTPIAPGKIGVVDHELAGQTVSTSAKSDETLKTGDRVRIIMVQGDLLMVKKLRDKVPEDLMPGLESEHWSEQAGRDDGKNVEKK